MGYGYFQTSVSVISWTESWLVMDIHNMAIFLNFLAFLVTLFAVMTTFMLTLGIGRIGSTSDTAQTQVRHPPNQAF